MASDNASEYQKRCMQDFGGGAYTSFAVYLDKSLGKEKTE